MQESAKHENLRAANNYYSQKRGEVMLTEKELKDARKIIAKTTAGCYVLSKMYGKEKWSLISVKTLFGKRFKESVDSGSLTGVTYKNKAGDNAAIYIVE